MDKMGLSLKIIRLFLGLALYSIGILLTVHANIGVSPWDVLHIAITRLTPLTFGQVGQLVGVVLIIICIFLKESPGWGTLANILVIGWFIDIIEYNGWIPDATGIVNQILMLLAGIMVIGWATFFYINEGLGVGPRDGLMVGLIKKFSAQVWIIRTGIEVGVAALGFALGGPLGIGTVLTAVLVGPAVQLAYFIGKKDAAKIDHRTLLDDYNAIRNKYLNKTRDVDTSMDDLQGEEV